MAAPILVDAKWAYGNCATFTLDADGLTVLVLTFCASSIRTGTISHSPPPPQQHCFSIVHYIPQVGFSCNPELWPGARRTWSSSTWGGVAFIVIVSIGICIEIINSKELMSEDEDKERIWAMRRLAWRGKRSFDMRGVKVGADQLAECIEARIL